MVAALATLGAGVTLVWALVRPGVVEQVGTMSLAGVVALLAAPGLALAALRLDSRVARAVVREAVGVGGGGLAAAGRVVAHARARRWPRENRRARPVRVGPAAAPALTADSRA